MNKYKDTIIYDNIQSDGENLLNVCHFTLHQENKEIVGADCR